MLCFGVRDDDSSLSIALVKELFEDEDHHLNLIVQDMSDAGYDGHFDGIQVFLLEKFRVIHAAEELLSQTQSFPLYKNFNNCFYINLKC